MLIVGSVKFVWIGLLLHQKCVKKCGKNRGVYCLSIKKATGTMVALSSNGFNVSTGQGIHPPGFFCPWAGLLDFKPCPIDREHHRGRSRSRRQRSEVVWPLPLATSRHVRILRLEAR